MVPGASRLADQVHKRLRPQLRHLQATRSRVPVAAGSQQPINLSINRRGEDLALFRVQLPFSAQQPLNV